LAQMGDKRALEPSLAALEEKDPKVRREAAKALGRLRDKRAVEPLISALRDDDAGVCYSAASALGALGDVRAVEPLIAALKDPDPWVRGGVAGALAGLGDKRAVEPMRAALRRGDGTPITPVAVALAGLVRDESAVGPLLAALDHPDSEWTELEVFQAVIIIGPRAVKPLVAGLQHDNVRVRRTIVKILAKTGHEGAVEALVSALKDADGDVARSAAYGLAELDDPRALQPLAVVLKDSKSAVWRKTEVPLREKAASLGSLAASAPPDLAPLIAALEDEHWHLRLSAAWVLGRLGDKRATEALDAALKTAEHAGQVDDGWMRGAWICAQALARLGSSSAVPPLVDTLRRESASDEHPGGISEADAWCMRLQQKWVSKALEALAAVGPAAVEPLIALLEDANLGVRSAAAQGLGRLGDKRALDALKAGLKDPDQQVRESAAGAIRAIQSKSPQ
jgi:HEAT repeat protein